MTRSTCSAVAGQGKRSGRIFASRVCICLIVLLVFAGVFASAQTTAVPPTSTIQVLGISPTTPAPSNPPTAPVGGIILYGSNISAITHQPVRHFWIGDTNFGICRVDPDIDSANQFMAANPGQPSPYNITVSSCPFKVNGLSVTGGPMAFDPKTNSLYLTDEQTNSEGIFRLGYLPTGDSGEGAIDFNNVLPLAGNITGSRFSGGTTGCPFPPDATETLPNSNPPAPAVFGVPNGMALAPDGSLWISFKKQSGIIRIVNPATASSSGFGTCADLVQLVAAAPATGGGNGIVFLGHDMWGSLEAGPFFIPNADTTCQALGVTVPQAPTCGTRTPTDPTFAALATTTIYGDQTFPYLNGDNLYFGSATDDLWASNIAAGGIVSGNPYEPAGAFVDGAIVNIAVNAVVVDMTDPANNVLWSGDDPSGAAILAQGRWWQVTQNAPAVAAAPGAPTVVRASAVGNTVTLSWSPAQNGVPVTSYTVQTLVGGVAVATQTVSPTGAGLFPPNFVVIAGLANGTYTFSVVANNAVGSSAATVSAPITLPFVVAPGIPTNVTATAGNAAAFVSFVPPINAATQGITSYTVTSVPTVVGGGGTATVAANATSAIVTGLKNGTTYTFVVNANNAGGAGLKSTPSNPVTPSAAFTVGLTLNAPASVPTTNVMATVSATLTNSTTAPITGTTLNYALTQATPDGASVLIGQAGQGSCTNTATTAACNIGTVAPGASVTVSFIVQIKSNNITSTVSFNTTTVTGTQSLTAPSQETDTPGAPPAGGTTPMEIDVTAQSAKPTLNHGAGTTHTFIASNTTSNIAQNVVFTIAEPTGITINSVQAASSLSSDPASCQAPKPNQVLNGQSVTTITCNIAQLGGNLKNGNKVVQAQTMTITVSITGNVTLTKNVSATVVFNGIDIVNPTATFQQVVR
jgi:hypothetical protein